MLSPLWTKAETKRQIMSPGSSSTKKWKRYCAAFLFFLGGGGNSGGAKTCRHWRIDREETTDRVAISQLDY